MLILLATLLIQDAGPSTACRLTEADLAANRAMSFAEFDQAGSDRPSTGWNLAIARCFAEAARANEDYLATGPILSEHDRVVVAWHMALDLASAGRETEAAPLVAASVYDAEPAEDAFDWNTYVRGVWAFLRKDRPLLDRSLAVLRDAPGQRNAINARALSRLSTCFDHPYREAIDSPQCAIE